MDGDRLTVVKATREQDPAYRAVLLYSALAKHEQEMNTRNLSKVIVI